MTIAEISVNDFDFVVNSLISKDVTSKECWIEKDQENFYIGTDETIPNLDYLVKYNFVKILDNFKFKKKILCWFEAIDLYKDSIHFSEEIIVHLKNEDTFKNIIKDLLTYSSDNISYFTNNSDYFLKIVNPSYYVILKYFKSSVVYNKLKNNIYCQCGYKYAYDETLQCNQNGILFVNNNKWFVLSDIKFNDIYSILSFNIENSVSINRQCTKDKIEVKLSLINSEKDENFNLATLSGNDVFLIEEMLDLIPKKEMNRYRFCFLEKDGEMFVILRTLHGYININMDEFKKYKNISNNTYVPINKKIHPNISINEIEKNLGFSYGNIYIFEDEKMRMFEVQEEQFYALYNWINKLCGMNFEKISKIINSVSIKKL